MVSIRAAHDFDRVNIQHIPEGCNPLVARKRHNQLKDIFEQGFVHDNAHVTLAQSVEVETL